MEKMWEHRLQNTTPKAIIDRWLDSMLDKLDDLYPCESPFRFEWSVVDRVTNKIVVLTSCVAGLCDGLDSIPRSHTVDLVVRVTEL